ncbi:MAG: hypothetical protein ABJK39_05685 [Hyphomicrobiales bacterium]
MKNLLTAALFSSSCFLTGAAFAEDDVSADVFRTGGFYGAVEAGASFRSGSTNTTNGGSAFGGGGVSRDVEFGSAYSIGGRLGYEVSPKFSYFISYDHIDGDLDFRADFPAIANFDQRYGGKATTDLVLANVAYSMPILKSSRLKLGLGVGVAFNEFRDIVENAPPPNPFFAIVDDGQTTNFAARVTAGIEHDFNDSLSFTLNAGLDYYGDFETGSSRLNFGAPPADPIGEYEIENVWGATVSGAFTYRF